MELKNVAITVLAVIVICAGAFVYLWYSHPNYFSTCPPTPCPKCPDCQACPVCPKQTTCPTLDCSVCPPNPITDTLLCQSITISNNPGADSGIHLSDIQVFDKNGLPLVTGKSGGVALTQSDYFNERVFPPENAIDKSWGTFISTNPPGDKGNWVKIDLGKPTEISKVIIYGRFEDGYKGALVGTKLTFNDGTSDVVKTAAITTVSPIYVFQGPFINNMKVSSNYC